MNGSAPGKSPAPAKSPAPGKPADKGADPPSRTEMTDQMDPVDEATQYRRQIDDTIARFSAAHDELEAEEAERRQRRGRITAGPARLIEQTVTRLQRVVGDNGETDDADEGQAGNQGERNGKRPPRSGAERTAGAADSSHGETAGPHEPRQEGDGKSQQSRLQEKRRRRTERSTLACRITACVVAALVFLATAAGWGAKEWFNANFRDVAALDPGSEAIHNQAQQIGDANFLVVGSDTRAGAEQENVGTSAQVPGARSDTVLLVHVPKDRHRVVIVSFMRDMEISRPQCERWDADAGEYTGETVQAASQVKLNTAYAFGGPKCVTKVIQDITHMEVTHFVGLDFSGFKDIVSAVGGVTVDVEKPMIDRELGTVVPEAGETHLEGQQALQYMRARKLTNDPTAGYGRVERQQKFIGALLHRVMSEDVLLDTGKLSKLVDAFRKAAFGANLGFDQLLTLARSMRKMDSGGVKFVRELTTEKTNQRGNEVLDERKADEVFTALIEGRPLPGAEQDSGSGQTSGESSAQAHPGR